MWISGLKLVNWKNFTRIEVDLTPRLFLVGPNASGKSNFLDAIRFLRELVIPGGGFQKAVLDRGDISKIRCLAARRSADLAIEVALSNHEGQVKPSWRYRISFSQDNNKNPILKEEKVWKETEILLERPSPEDKKDPARLSQTALEQINENKNFREIPEFFKKIFYFHLVPHLIRNSAYAVYAPQNDPFGRDLLVQMARSMAKRRQSRLKKIESILKLAVPQLQSLAMIRDHRGRPHLRVKYEHWRYDAEHNEEMFSDGTLRLIGLLWSLFEGDGPILLEEPELSLHPGIVRHLAPLMFRLLQKRKRQVRQVIMSTHSPELLSDPGIGGEEILLFIPYAEGTKVEPASSYSAIRALLESGMTVADAALPYTEPVKFQHLSLFQ